MQKNLWYASRRTQRSIDRSEDVFAGYPVCVISVAVIVLLLNDAYFSESLLWFTIGGVYFNFSNETVIQSFGVCLQINCVVTKDPRTHCFLNWDSWFFTRWVPGLIITIYNKITASEITFLTNTIQGGLTLLTLLWSLKWRKHFNSSYPASLTETRDPELPDPFLLPISHELP